MFTTLFSKKTPASISLFLGMNRLAICLLQEGKVSLLAQADISSDAQWEEELESLVNAHQLQKYQVSVVLSRDFYQTIDIEKPKVEESELLASLPFAIKELVTESIFDLVVDYYDRPFVQHKGEQITVVCVAKQRIIRIRDMLLKYAMRLKEVTTEELALTRLLENSDEANLLLSQQNNEIVLTVAKAGQLFFTHRLRGYNELLALPLDEPGNTLVESLSLELQRVLDYLNSQLRLTSISHLYLALVCPDIALLAEKLGDYLAKEVAPFAAQEQYDFENITAYGVLMEGKTA